MATGADAYATTYSYDADNRLMNEVKTTSASTETVAASTGNERVSLSEGVAGCELSRYNGSNQLVGTNVDGVAAEYT